VAISGAEVEAYVAAHIDVRDALAELLERRGVLCCYDPDLALTPEDRQEVFQSAAEEIIGGLFENGWILVRKPVATNPGVPQEVD